MKCLTHSQLVLRLPGIDKEAGSQDQYKVHTRQLQECQVQTSKQQSASGHQGHERQACQAEQAEGNVFKNPLAMTHQAHGSCSVLKAAAAHQLSQKPHLFPLKEAMLSRPGAETEGSAMW